ncbi:MAG: hypothetical protein ACRDD1_01150, partial [Planctomycetia bacterium]
ALGSTRTNAVEPPTEVPPGVVPLPLDMFAVEPVKVAAAPVLTAPFESYQRRPLPPLVGPFAGRVAEIVRRPLCHRQGEVEVFPCSGELFDWLIDHPLSVADMWRKLGMPMGEVRATADGCQCTDGQTSIRFHTVVAEPGLRIVYCVGEARRPLLPGPLRAEMVLIHQSRRQNRPDGRGLVAHQLEGFVGAKGPAVRTIMKLARGTSEQLMEQCLQETTLFFSIIGRVTQLRPQWAVATVHDSTILAPATAEHCAAELAGMLARLPPPPARGKSPAGGPAPLPSPGGPTERIADRRLDAR